MRRRRLLVSTIGLAVVLATSGCSRLGSGPAPSDAALVVFPTSDGADLLNTRNGAAVAHIPKSVMAEPEQRTSLLFSPMYWWIEHGEIINAIDRTGKKFLNVKAQPYSSYHEGLARTRIGPVWGYIDQSWKVVVPPEYLECSDFSEGVAAVQKRADDEGHASWGFIDKTGKMVIPRKHYGIRDFMEGLAAVQDYKSSLWGYIDHSGALVVPYAYRDAGDFHNGIAGVSRDNRSFYIDKAGGELTSLGASWTPFSEERAVRAKGILIDTKGTVIPTPRLEPVSFRIQTSMNTSFMISCSIFQEGLMRVHPDGGNNYVLLDRGGKFVTGPKLNIERIAPGFWYAQNQDGTSEVLQNDGKPIRTPSRHCRPLEHEFDMQGNTRNRYGLLICIDGDLPTAERFRNVRPEMMPRGNRQAMYFSVYGWQSPKFLY